MQPAKRFEELAFWQQARELTRLIYALTQKNGFAKDYGLKDQIQRASVSVMSNIAEVAKTMNTFIRAVKRTGRFGLKARKEHLSFREEVERLLQE